MDTKELLFAISGLMSVSGSEYREREKLKTLVTPYFDEVNEDYVGNCVFIKRCGKAKAKRVLVDTHFDEIGLMVKGITDEGFLRVCGVGGVDAHTLPACNVIVYGKNELEGVIFRKALRDDVNTLVSVSDTLVDIGSDSKKQTEKLVSIGDKVGFKPEYTELKNGFVSGKGFDNKASCTAAVLAMSKINAKKLDCDIYVCFSAKEEVGHRAASSAAYSIDPDCAVVIDVTFARTPDCTTPACVKFGDGVSVSLSATLNRELADEAIATAVEKEIKHKVIIEPTSTGTHADDIAFMRNGIPTVLFGIPLAYMHTQRETVMLSDIESTAELIAELINEKYGKKKREVKAK